MIWCHACQKETVESQFSKTCVKCGSWAIEDSSTSETSPNQFRPFTLGETEQRQESQEQTQDRQEGETGIPFPLNFRIVVMESIDRPGSFTVARIISRGLPNFPETRNPISKEVIEKMEKVEHVSECTICQEDDGEGLKLKCKHTFHQHCIEPWFEQSNTCPTCRTPVQ